MVMLNSCRHDGILMNPSFLSQAASIDLKVYVINCCIFNLWQKAGSMTLASLQWLSGPVFSQGFHMYACEGNVEISAFVGAALQRAGVCLSEQWQRGMNQAFDHLQLSDH